MKTFTFLLTTILPFSYMGLIWYLSSYPSDAIVSTGLSFDATIKEGLHLVEFSILYVLWFLFLLSHGRFTTRTSKLAAMAALVYGLIDEIHQYFVPSRSATLIDLVKDAAGVLLAAHLINRWFFQSRNTALGRCLHKIETLLRKQEDKDKA